ncbi:MAG: aminotransferase class I/II-fold pyridoxal phosphate-dependent enzyme [Planctomycetota bacterium]
MPVAHALQPFGETIFAEMSRLAIEHSAINLGQGFPNFDGPSFIKDAAIAALRDGKNQYARSFGIPELNEAIADDHQQRFGRQIDPTMNVTVTSGCTEAIAATMFGLLNPGDEIILFEPFYDSYRACVAMAGAKARFVTMNGPSFRFERAALEAAVTPTTRAILINTPHNPTGRVFDRDELQVIADVCIKHDLIAIVDEVYEHLVFDGEHLSLATWPGMAERTMLMSSLGKTFSLTGWKIGWAIAPSELTQAIRAAHQFLTFSTATPLQHGAVAAIRAPASYFESYASAYRERRDVLVDGLRSVGFGVEAPAGTYFVMADISPFGADDDRAFCRHLIEHVGVAGIPPSVFYAESDEGTRYLRFAFCKDIETLRRALDRMHERLR